MQRGPSVADFSPGYSLFLPGPKPEENDSTRREGMGNVLSIWDRVSVKESLVGV